MLDGVLDPLLLQYVGNGKSAVAVCLNGPHIALGSLVGYVKAIVGAGLIDIAAIALHDGIATIGSGEHKLIGGVFLLDDAIHNVNIGNLQIAIVLGYGQSNLAFALGNKQIALATLDRGSLLVLTLTCGLWVGTRTGIGCGTALDSYEVGIQHLNLVFFRIISASTVNR